MVIRGLAVTISRMFQTPLRRAEQHDDLDAAGADAVPLLQLGHDLVGFAHLLSTLQVRDQEPVEAGPDGGLRVGVEVRLADRDERLGAAPAQPGELFVEAERAWPFCSAGSEWRSRVIASALWVQACSTAGWSSGETTR